MDNRGVIHPKVRKADSRRRRGREDANRLWKAINPEMLTRGALGSLLPALGGRV